MKGKTRRAGDAASTGPEGFPIARATFRGKKPPLAGSFAAADDGV